MAAGYYDKMYKFQMIDAILVNLLVSTFRECYPWKNESHTIYADVLELERNSPTWLKLIEDCI